MVVLLGGLERLWVRMVYCEKGQAVVLLLEEKPDVNVAEEKMLVLMVIKITTIRSEYIRK